MSYSLSNSKENAHEANIFTCCWTHSNTKLIVTGSLDYSVKIWNSTDLSLKSEYQHQLSVISVDSDCSGKYIASSSLDNNIILYSIPENKIQQIIRVPEPIWTLSFSKDSTWIACGTSNSSAIIYDVETGNQKLKLCGSKANKYTMSIACSLDKKHIGLSSMDGSVQLFNAETFQFLQKLPEVHTSPIRSISFSDDSTLFATASDDGQIKMHDIRNYAPSGTLSGHSSWVLSVAFNHHFIASGSSDNKVKIWDIRNRQCIETFSNHSDQIWSVSHNEARSKLVSVGDDAKIQLYTCMNSSLK